MSKKRDAQNQFCGKPFLITVLTLGICQSGGYCKTINYSRLFNSRILPSTHRKH